MMMLTKLHMPMATESQIKEKIYSVLQDHSRRFHSSLFSPTSDIFNQAEVLKIRQDLSLDEGDIIGLYSELSNEFNIDINDLMDAYLPTVGDLVTFILGRVNTD